MTVCVFYVLSLSNWCSREIHVCSRNLKSQNVNFVRQEGGNRVKKDVIETRMIAHSAV